MDDLHKLLSDAGLSNLLGGSKASRMIGALMSKNSTNNYQRPGIKPFNAKKLNNPSPFIQKKYLDGDVKPFDYCKAQQRKQTEEPEPEWKKPEYWGLTRDDLTKSGSKYITKDGLVFPPFEWTSPWNGKTYIGLAKHEPGSKRLTMIYFKDFPDKKGLPDDITFSETQARKRGLKNVSQYTREEKLESLGDEDTIRYNGVELKGTNRVLIRKYVKKRKDAGKKKRMYGYGLRHTTLDDE